MNGVKPKIYCVYCGNEISRKLKNETKDHVPPKSFFTPPFPINMQNVPCCKPCNTKFSILDEYIKTIFAIREDVVDSGKYPDLVANAPKLFKHKTKYWDKFYKDIEVKDVITPAGIILPKKIMFSIDGKKISEFLIRLIKAFYFKKFKVILPKEVDYLFFDIKEFDKQEFSSKQLFSSAFVALKDLSFNNPSNNLKYRLKTYDKLYPVHSIWHFKFFNVENYYVVVTNKVHNKVDFVDL